MPPLRPVVSIIGAGKVGSALALALANNGYPIGSIISRTQRSAQRLERAVSCDVASTDLKKIVPATRLIIIATPDDVIAGVAAKLAALKHLPFKKMLVVHTSGVSTSALLDPLRKKGALVASLHPIQTFPKSLPMKHLIGSLLDITYGIEGDRKALTLVKSLVDDLNGFYIVIPKRKKALYHALCVFGSGYLMVSLNVLYELFKTLKSDHPWDMAFDQMIMTSLLNAYRTSPVEAFSGPILRKDLSTTEKHLEALAVYAPQFIPIYSINALEFARASRDAGKISKRDYKAVHELISMFLRTNTPSTI